SCTIRLQQPTRAFHAHRFAEEIALRIFAAELLKVGGVGVGLSTFSDDFHSEVMRERDDGRQQQRTGTLAVWPHEGAVNLQRVKRETLQVGERGMSGAEVIEREPGAQF